MIRGRIIVTGTELHAISKVAERRLEMERWFIIRDPLSFSGHAAGVRCAQGPEASEIRFEYKKQNLEKIGTSVRVCAVRNQGSSRYI